MCASIIIRGLSVDNAVDVLNLADSYPYFINLFILFQFF